MSSNSNVYFLTVAGLLTVLLVGTVTVGYAAQEYEQASSLAKKVKSGALPPVEERLPKSPKVVGEPLIKQIGNYGGSYRYGITHEVGTYLWPECTMGERQDIRPLVGGYLVKATHDPQAYGGQRLRPQLAKSWEWSNKGKTLTMHLREEVKWSDGEPFTADDVIFTFRDIIMHQKIGPAAAIHFTYSVDGKQQQVKIKKVDQYTVRFQLPVVDSTFLWKFASAPGIAMLPRHRLIDDHPDYNENATIGDLVRARNSRKKTVSLGPWTVERYVPGQQVVLKRNPYYWKVDQAGHQLPYIDKVIARIYKSRETLITDFMAGGIDSYGRFAVVPKFPTIKRHADSGNYTVYLKRYTEGPGLFFNLGSPPEKLDSILRNVQFRKALSLALNRNLLGRIYAPGRFKPTVRSFSPVSRYHDPEAVPAPTYNPQQAKQLLTDLGLKDTDGDGYRDLPSGKSLVLNLMVAPRGVVDLTQVARKQWEKVGIKTNISTPGQSSFISRLTAGKYEIWASRGMGFPTSPLIHTIWWVAPPPGEEGEESIGIFNISNWKLKWNQEAYQLFAKTKRTRDLKQRRAIMAKAESVLSHAYPGIGLFWVRMSYAISDRLGNHIKRVGIQGTFPTLYAEVFFVKD